MVVLDSLS
jgi:uncharacterized protein with HEPN domain